MMNLIRSVVGNIAVAFSIQPLASWAAASAKKDSVEGMNVSISKGTQGQEKSEGSPMCRGGKTAGDKFLK
jgi:hypothetical protein